MRKAILLLLMLAATTAWALETERQDLSGKGFDDDVRWEFSCSGGNKGGQWTTIRVPSCWDAEGFGTLTYGRVGKDQLHSNERGQYRHRFHVPAAWEGRTIHLVFEGSMTDTTAWVNGHSAGPIHQGAFYRFKYDVTKLVKPGAENLLEVTVEKESSNESVNRAERRGDYWNFGGIFRPVYLEALPPQHVERVAIDARADGTFTMEVFTSGVTTADTVRAQIFDAAGTPVGDLVPQTLSNGKARIQTKLDAPKSWTAETPNLYHVEVTLAQGDAELHRMRQRFGFRTIEVRAGDGVYVNGRRIILKGTNRHTFSPDFGRASSERLSRADIALMKEMNNNAVRMSHYPPDEHFLDACDEAGLYVLDELAGWHQPYDTPTATRLIEQMVTRDVNHPSILFWDNGNEGGWNTEADDEFAKWDPQGRNVLHPWSPFRGVDTKHYPVYDLLVKLSAGPDVFLPTEFQHALFDGGGGTALGDYWNVLRTGKTSAGGFIWAFCDETMKRKDGNGRFDSVGNMAPDGVVGPYREKEASFYTVKQIFSPIVATRDGSGRISIENRYDFTNARRCKFTWQLRKFVGPAEAKSGFDVVAEGVADAPSIPPQTSGALKLDLPANLGDADALALRVEDPAGVELWTWVWPLKKPDELAKVSVESGSAKVIAKEDNASITVTAADLSLSFSKTTGHLAAVRRGAQTFPLSNGPRLAVGDAKLVSIEHRADGADHVVTGSYTGDMKSVQWRVSRDGWVTLSYTYTLNGTYDFFGVSFDLPERDVKGMKWLGNGPFRVWKNRLGGGTLNVWENTYNNTMTGYNQGPYPEFKGYYAGVRWMRLETADGPILISIDDPSLYVQLLRPEFPENPKPLSPTTAATRPISTSAHLSANAWANFPQAGFSILHGIAPMGTKFNTANQLGPQSQQNIAEGEYRGGVRFFFGEAK